MIPYSFLSKMRPYEVEVHGAKVTVSVVTGNASLIDQKISELTATLKMRVMGVDLKIVSSIPSMLLLCAEDRCLIIPSFGAYVRDSYYPNSIQDVTKSTLGKLLSDQSICFVGMNFWRWRSSLHSLYDGNSSNVKLTDMVVKAGVELGHLTAMILKKPSLQSKGLTEIAGEVDIVIKPLSTSLKTDDIFCAKYFSDDDIKVAVHDVYGSYLVGKKLLGTLEK